MKHIKNFILNEDIVVPNIPTSDEYFKSYSSLYHFEEGDTEYLIDKEDFQLVMIEFARHHVKAALELKTYPLTNIK